MKVNIAVPTYNINLLFVIKAHVCNVDDYNSITRERKAELFNTPRKWIVIGNIITFTLKNLLHFRLVKVKVRHSRNRPSEAQRGLGS